MTQKGSRPVLIKTSGSWQAARLSSQCLGFSAAIPTPHLDPEHVQCKPHKEQSHVTSPGWLRGGTGSHLLVQEWIWFSLCFLSWSPGVWFRVLQEQGCEHTREFCNHLWCLHSKGAVTSLVEAALSSGVGVGICATNCGGCGAVKLSIWQNNSESA